jgi:O-antigen ligase
VSANTIPRISDDRRLPLVLGVFGAAMAASLLYTAVPLAFLVGVLAFGYFISRPYELLLVMVFLIPFNFIFKIGPFPMAAEMLKVFEWVPFLICVATLGRPFRASRYHRWLVLLGALIFLSVFHANDLPFTLKESVRFGSNLGLCYLVPNLVDSREKVLQVFRVLTISTFLVACYGFYQFAIQDYGALFWIVNPRLDTALAPGRETFWIWRNRMISVLTSEMELGHYFNLCLPLGLALWLVEGRRRLSSRWLWMSVATLAALVLTFTFGAWLALAATIAFFVLIFDKKQRWRMILAGTFTASVAIAVVSFSSLRLLFDKKLLGTGIGSLAWDVLTRLDSWLFAAQVWWAHPLFGVGVGNFQALQFQHDFIHSPWAPVGGSPHETYLYLLVQVGIVGLIATLVIMLGNIRGNLRLKAHPELGPMALALAFALIVNMFGWFSDDSSFFGPHASYLVWLLLGLSEAVRRLATPKPAVNVV